MTLEFPLRFMESAFAESVFICYVLKITEDLLQKRQPQPRTCFVFLFAKKTFICVFTAKIRHKVML
ncbi:MAG: hypothetical protein A2173_08765 [Planctomycetes bacterium RBG_13_44_8b]|nr:MAG: hypothetical protein A2173_08765 [Planctomycetes bacterium RBG_13_44_8b]